jgi:hypothetical protein
MSPRRPRNSKVNFTNTDNILQSIKDKLSTRAEMQKEYEEVEKKYLELKEKYNKTERLYVDSATDLNSTKRSISVLYRQLETSWFKRLWHRIAQVFQRSKTDFFVFVIVIAMAVASVYFTFRQDHIWQALLVELGFALIFLIYLLRKPKYRGLMVMAMLALVYFILSNVTTDAQQKSNYMSIGLALIGTGLALHAFNMGESTEKQLEKIDTLENKLDELLDIKKKGR